jgi:hypothetical protein
MSEEGYLVPKSLYDKLRQMARDYETGAIPPSQIKDNVRPTRRVTLTEPIGAESVGTALRHDNGISIDVYNPTAADVSGTVAVYWSSGDEVSAHNEDDPVRRGQWEIVSGGGACTCQEVHEIRIDGTATAGTISVAYTIGTSGSASINWNSTAAAAKTALIAGHSFFTTNNINVYDGPFPNAGFYIVFGDDLADIQVRLPAVTSSLTGGGVGKAYRTSAGAEYAP